MESVTHIMQANQQANSATKGQLRVVQRMTNYLNYFGLAEVC